MVARSIALPHHPTPSGLRESADHQACVSRYSSSHSPLSIVVPMRLVVPIMMRFVVPIMMRLVVPIMMRLVAAHASGHCMLLRVLERSFQLHANTIDHTSFRCPIQIQEAQPRTRELPVPLSVGIRPYWTLVLSRALCAAHTCIRTAARVRAKPQLHAMACSDV